MHYHMCEICEKAATANIAMARIIPFKHIIIKPVRYKNRIHNGHDVSGMYSTTNSFFWCIDDNPDDDRLSKKYLENRTKQFFGNEPGKIGIIVNLGMGNDHFAKRDDVNQEIKYFEGGTMKEFFNGYDLLVGDFEIVESIC